MGPNIPKPLNSHGPASHWTLLGRLESFHEFQGAFCHEESTKACRFLSTSHPAEGDGLAGDHRPRLCQPHLSGCFIKGLIVED